MGVCGVWRASQVQPPPEHLSVRAVTGQFLALEAIAPSVPEQAS